MTLGPPTTERGYRLLMAARSARGRSGPTPRRPPREVECP